jgi:hypothetical protein
MENDVSDKLDYNLNLVADILAELPSFKYISPLIT